MSDPHELPPPPAANGHLGPAPSRFRRWRIPATALVVALIAGVGVLLALGRAPAPNARGARSTPSPDTTRVVRPPRELHAAAGTFRVVLRWKLGSGDLEPSGFHVYRDGEVVATLGASDRVFADDQVVPATDYRYEVESFDSLGNQSSRASVSMETKTPPVTSARLAGIFDIRLTKTNSYGVTGLDERMTAGWRFNPGCDAGACDPSWRYLGFAELSTELDRDRGTYTGSTSARGFLQCRGTPTLSTFRVTLRVAKAHTIGDEWRAIALRGTMTVHDAAQLGCRESHITYSITATLVR